MPPARVGRLSGLGYGMGNVATLLLLVFVLVFIALPMMPWFGLDPAAHEQDRSVGPISAVWFVVFSIPFFLWTPDRPKSAASTGAMVRQGLTSLMGTLGNVRHYANVARFLLARMIYNDGLNVMLGFGGVYASGVFGWRIVETGLYGLIVIPFAAAGGYTGGRLADRIGTKHAAASSGDDLAGFLARLHAQACAVCLPLSRRHEDRALALFRNRAGVVLHRRRLLVILYGIPSFMSIPNFAPRLSRVGTEP